MVQILQKCLLCGSAEGLYSQRSGVGLFPGHLGLPVLLYIPHQLIKVVLPAVSVEPCKVSGVGKHDQLVSGPGDRHVDQLLVVLQPFIGFFFCLVRQGCGKQHHILFITLKGMHRAAHYIVQPLPCQRLLDHPPLVHKRGDHADALVPVASGISYDGRHLLRGGVPHKARAVLYIHVHQRMLLSALGADVQSGIVVFPVIELYDLCVAPVMIPQQNLVADRVAGQKGLIDGISAVIILLRHLVLPAQRLVHHILQKDHRTQLLGIPHQHQVLPPDHRDKGHRGIALAGLVHDHHVEHGLRLSQTVGGNAGGDDDRKNLLQPFHILRLLQIFHKGIQLLLPLRFKEDLPQLLILLALQLFDVPCGDVEKIFQQLVQIIVQQGQRILVRDISRPSYPVLHLTQLASLQIRLKGQHLHRNRRLSLIFQQTVQGLAPLF